MRLFIAFILFSMTTLPAYSQIVVLGSGLARDCYEAAKDDTSFTRGGIETCTKALSHTPLKRENRLATYVNRGILYMRSENYPEAQSDYDRALKIKPDNEHALINRGASYVFQGEYDSAMESLNKAIEVGSEQLYAAYYNRAVVHEIQGDLWAAYQDLQKSLELKPDYEMALVQIERFVVEDES